MFPPPVFVFQLAQLLHVADFQPRMLGTPFLRGGLQDAVLSAELVAPRPALSILEHDDDLFLRVPFSNHGPLL